MNRKYTLIGISLLLFVFLFTPKPVSASTFTLDGFDAVVNGLVVTANSGTSTAFGTVDDPSVLGGERDIFVQWASGLGGDVKARSVNPGGFFAHAQDPGLRGRTTITWDGNDSNATSLDPVGLGGVNLQSPTNDAFMLYLISSDANTSLRFRVYTDALNWSEAIIVVVANTSGQLVTVPFSSFVIGAGASGPVDFTNAGAVELLINSAGIATLDLDMVIDFFMAADSTSYRDFGDLPDVYGTLLTSNGPRHIISSLYLGVSVDDESNGTPTVGADGDSSDENGVARVGFWNNGVNGGAIDVTVTTLSSACLAGWIDFNNDGDFSDADEELFYTTDYLGLGVTSNMTAVNNGSNGLTFAIPAGTFTGSGGNLTFHARFRVVPDRNIDGWCIPQSEGGDEPAVASIGEYANGEVEDYVWQFTPTAISLQMMNVSSTSSVLPLSLIGVLVVASVSTGVIVYRRRQLIGRIT